MKNITLLTLILASLTLASGCNTKRENPQSATAEPSSGSIEATAQASDDGIFKYTITTDISIESEYDEWQAQMQNSDEMQILVAMNTLGGNRAKYDLDCEGDGDFEFEGLTRDKKCIYKKNSGKHQIWVRGEIPGMFLCKKPNSERTDEIYRMPRAVLSIDSWGNVAWKSMLYFAAGCEALNKIPEDSPNLRQVKDMRGMFYEAKAFNQPIEAWDVSSVTNMHEMFYDAESFNQPLESWNVSNVTDMSDMFRYAKSFNQPLEKWNVSNVTKMSQMFFEANSFNQPLEAWNVSNVTDMAGMFLNAALFNQPLGKWNVSKVTDMSAMFSGAKSFNQSLEAWNVANVTDMGFMFALTHAFNQPLNA